MGDFSDRVFEQVRRIPQGKVSTYGQIARLIGSPRSARFIAGLYTETSAGESAVPSGGLQKRSPSAGYAFGGEMVQHASFSKKKACVSSMRTMWIWERLYGIEESTHMNRPANIDWEREMGND